MSDSIEKIMADATSAMTKAINHLETELSKSGPEKPTLPW